MAFSLRDRLIAELEGVRRELVEAVGPIADRDLDYMPAPGMKSYRALLKEIGGEEVESLGILLTGEMPENAQSQVTGETAAELLDSLDAIRAKSLVYLADRSDEQLRVPVAMPKDMWPYLGMELEPEELIRGFSRHEYYHLGQIIIYRWIQGFSPYA